VPVNIAEPDAPGPLRRSTFTQNHPSRFALPGMGEGLMQAQRIAVILFQLQKNIG